MRPAWRDLFRPVLVARLPRPRRPDGSTPAGRPVTTQGRSDPPVQVRRRSSATPSTPMTWSRAPPASVPNGDSARDSSHGLRFVDLHCHGRSQCDNTHAHLPQASATIELRVSGTPSPKIQQEGSQPPGSTEPFVAVSSTAPTLQVPTAVSGQSGTRSVGGGRPERGCAPESPSCSASSTPVHMYGRMGGLLIFPVRRRRLRRRPASVPWAPSTISETRR